MQRGGATGLERGFGYAVSDSDSDDEVKRKVVSKKDKYTDELKDSVKKLNNFIKISDWKSVKDGEPTDHRPGFAPSRPSAAAPPLKFLTTLFCLQRSTMCRIGFRRP